MADDCVTGFLWISSRRSHNEIVREIVTRAMASVAAPPALWLKCPPGGTVGANRACALWRHMPGTVAVVIV